MYCKLCDRALDVEADPLSEDCGGDCWGCIGAIEYQTGVGEPERSRIEGEIAQGLRDHSGDPVRKRP